MLVKFSNTILVNWILVIWKFDLCRTGCLNVLKWNCTIMTPVSASKTMKFPEFVLTCWKSWFFTFATISSSLALFYALVLTTIEEPHCSFVHLLKCSLWKWQSAWMRIYCSLVKSSQLFLLSFNLSSSRQYLTEFACLSKVFVGTRLSTSLVFSHDSSGTMVDDRTLTATLPRNFRYNCNASNFSTKIFSFGCRRFRSLLWLLFRQSV